VFVTCHVADVRAAESRELYLGQHRPKRNCRVLHYSRCAAGMAVAEDKATTSVLVEQKERVPLGVWSASEERSKRLK
jgi:hypothetical protein